MYHKYQPQVRINNPTKLPYSEIENDLNDGNHVIIQFVGRTYSNSLLNDINKLCAKYDKNFGVRFYGHYSDFFDCETLLKIPNVKCLYIDATKAENLNYLKELNELKKLGIGIFDTKENEILDFYNLKDIEDLIVTETRKESINLKYLEGYKNLKSLMIGGHSKNIEAVGELSELETLTLKSVKKASVSFINNLKKLKTLNFILGGRENIDEVDGNEIEHLEILQVRGFRDIDNIERFSKLKNLIIENQIQLKKLVFGNQMPFLEDLRISNCKNLELISGIENLPNLQKVHISKTDLEFTEFIKQKLPISLKILSFPTGKAKSDAEIENKIEELGYKSTGYW